MNKGKGKGRKKDEWPWLNPNGGAKNMPGPYKPGTRYYEPGPYPSEPKYKGPNGPSKPNFGDPGLSKKN